MRFCVQSAAAVLTLCCLSFRVIEVDGQTEPGDECVVQRTNAPGICRPVAECPSVIDDIRNRRGNPTKCGFINKVQVVCCPDGVQPRTTSSSTTSATATLNSHPKIAEKCAEYGEAVYSKEYVSSPLGVDEPRLQRLDKCGHKAVELIVDGEAAKSREFPHMALIGYGGVPAVQYLCGGSLVSDRFVLTAGHCIISQEHGPATVVRLGELALDSSNDEAFPEDFAVAELIPHPEYKQSSQYNDIALIKLDRRVIFSPYIRPICLPMGAELGNRRAIATGWGTIGYGDATSAILLKVVLDMFGHEECAPMFEANRKLKEGLRSESQMCAGSRNSSKDTCQGDSGGPLQIYNDENVYCTYTIIGVTSFGKYCGLAGSPGVYSRVYAYISWIENLVF
ncbi:serine protease [Culex quinquefasciatus]|uniref:Serine protease n=1 Tax=Culex quinquefasciatus TaxID=7176 RepID=B0W1A9_CULQU|nr:venom protease isoform X2 [Culex quinquefasciatus]EDS44979.1 serine protease [Culex quinquefasciatus]|eukprot:XP_001842493.1 serine protease [Culex quinquefasciatus]